MLPPDWLIFLSDRETFILLDSEKIEQHKTNFNCNIYKYFVKISTVTTFISSYEAGKHELMNVLFVWVKTHWTKKVLAVIKANKANFANIHVS